MIFIDRSIPRPVAQALQLVRADVKWLEDEFSHDTTDAHWLREVGRRDWIVISRDKHIRTRPGERRAILEAGVGCFLLSQKKHPTRWGYLKLLAMTLDEMEQRFVTTARPFIYMVDANGRFTPYPVRVP